MRPAQLDPLFASLTSLSGIGDKTRQKLGLLLMPGNGKAAPALIDLLFHMPAGLINRKKLTSNQALVPGDIATLKVTVKRHFPPGGVSRKTPYVVKVADQERELSLIFYHARAPWVLQMLPEGEERLISGKIEVWQDRLQIVHPDYMVPLEKAHEIPQLEPVYPLTAGLTGKIVQKAILQALKALPSLEEWQDAPLLKQQKWPDFGQALQALHTPTSPEDIEITSPARRRLAYDELLAHQLVLALIRENTVKNAGRALVPQNDLEQKFLHALPFQLTISQQQALCEIYADMKAPHRMHRLLQGDVGSGKTVVSLLAALLAISAGTQAALMVPTEVLARQHLQSIRNMLGDLDIRAELLTGRDKGKKRKALLADLASGTIDLLIGTHALFQKDVVFHDLGLAIIDEQHRFGVDQRMALQEKGRADVLVMTATPIPRTLLMTHFGDMDVTSITDKPAGRQPIKTSLVNIERMDEMIAGLGRIFARGEQAYWICPLVEESEKMELAAATKRFEALEKHWPGRVGLIHGKLAAEEKDAVMNAFTEGRLDLLVATTVIEVGVNVVNATTMVIEHAERFGLAQLHQLRGRVGRGTLASNCILLFQSPLSLTAKARLKMMRSSEDGFRISEEDLRLRGGGELLGTRQSGVADYRLARFPEHADLLEIARNDAQMTITMDPELKEARGQALKTLLYLLRLDMAVKFMKAG